MSGFQLSTARLKMRCMKEEDLPALRAMLQDPVVMAAYEHTFSEQEVRDWLRRQYERYREYGMGLLAVCLKKTGHMIGQCGLTWQDIGAKKPVLEVGYLLHREEWGCGYAAEAARACRDYAFERMNAQEVYSVIRDTNKASRMVAVRNGMHCVGRIVKHYYEMEMPHDLYAISRREWLRATARPGASEAWDLLDADRNALHRTMLRRVRLPEGCYHLTVRIVVTDGEGKLLLVHSAKKKKSNMNLWECAGGAVLSGETSLRAAQRELCEETGIALDENELCFVGSVTMGNCHHDTYLAVKKLPLEGMAFQPGETDCARWVSFEEFEKMPAGRMPSPMLRRRLRTEQPFRQMIGLDKI